jgi:hypothetical protein
MMRLWRTYQNWVTGFSRAWSRMNSLASGLLLVTIVTACLAVVVPGQYIWLLCGWLVIVFVLFLCNHLMKKQTNSGKKNIFQFFESGQTQSEHEFEIDHDRARAHTVEKAKDVLRKLKERDIDLYSSPWYLVMGPSQSGKTFLIQQSKQDFSLVGDEPTADFGGTKGTKWSFTNKAIFIDTAGRYVDHYGKASADWRQADAQNDYEWGEFLTALKTLRPDTPLNGVIVTIRIEDLLSSEEGCKEALHKVLKNALQDLETRLSIRIPVYVVITMCDLIPGFVDFAEEYTRGGLKTNMMFGWSRDNNFDLPLHVENEFGTGFESICEKLSTEQLAILSDLPSNSKDETDRIDRLIGFLQEFRTMKRPLIDVLKQLFPREDKFFDHHFLRGVYFTSAVQEGNLLQSTLDQLIGNRPEQDERESLADITQEARPYFIADLFQDKIIQEPGLIRRTRNTARKSRRNRILLRIMTLIMMMVCGVKVFSVANQEDTPKVVLIAALENIEPIDDHKPTLLSLSKVGELQGLIKDEKDRYILAWLIGYQRELADKPPTLTVVIDKIPQQEKEQIDVEEIDIWMMGNPTPPFIGEYLEHNEIENLQPLTKKRIQEWQLEIDNLKVGEISSKISTHINGLNAYGKLQTNRLEKEDVKKYCHVIENSPIEFDAKEISEQCTQLGMAAVRINELLTWMKSYQEFHTRLTTADDDLVHPRWEDCYPYTNSLTNVLGTPNSELQNNLNQLDDLSPTKIIIKSEPDLKEFTQGIVDKFISNYPSNLGWKDTKEIFKLWVGNKARAKQLPRVLNLYKIMSNPKQPKSNFIYETQLLTACEKIKTDNVFFNESLFISLIGKFNYDVDVTSTEAESNNILRLLYNLEQHYKIRTGKKYDTTFFTADDLPTIVMAVDQHSKFKDQYRKAIIGIPVVSLNRTWFVSVTDQLDNIVEWKVNGLLKEGTRGKVTFKSTLTIGKNDTKVPFNNWNELVSIAFDGHSDDSNNFKFTFELGPPAENPDE